MVLFLKPTKNNQQILNSFAIKAASKFGVPDKKAVFFPYKKTAFLFGTPNLFGPSCFEAAL